jgi:hypothetical protein
VYTSEHLEFFPKPLKGARLDDLDHTFLPCPKSLMALGSRREIPSNLPPNPKMMQTGVLRKLFLC